MTARPSPRRSSPGTASPRRSPSARPTGTRSARSSCCSASERSHSTPGRRTVTLDSGATLGYDSLLIASGSRPRVLPGTEQFAGTHTLRTVEDAVRLRDALRPGAALVVVGAGFIGLEVAATARSLGLGVTVLEAAPAPLLRVLGPRLAGWFVEMHRAEGVEVLLSAHVARLGEGSDGTGWVQLTDGRRLECDALVVGIGIEPATEWLEGSGLDPGGVPTDSSGRTGAPDVYAAGDSARQLELGHRCP